MLKDWDLKHKGLCRANNAEQRKVKGGSKERMDRGEESLGQTFEKIMTMKNSHRIKDVVDGAKKVCEKEEDKRKSKRRQARKVVKAKGDKKSDAKQ